MHKHQVLSSNPQLSSHGEMGNGASYYIPILSHEGLKGITITSYKPFLFMGMSLVTLMRLRHGYQMLNIENNRLWVVGLEAVLGDYEIYHVLVAEVDVLTSQNYGARCSSA